MRMDVILFLAAAVAGDFISKEIPSPSTTTRHGDGAGPLASAADAAALEDDLFPATPTVQASSEPVTRYAELEDFSISSEDAGIQVYITFTQAAEEVRSSDVPVDHTPRADVDDSRNSTGGGVQETFIYSGKDEVASAPDLFDDTLEADLLPDVVASYVIPPFDYDAGNATAVLAPESVDARRAEENRTEDQEAPSRRAFDPASFNPYKHWDLDSEEQERELLMQKFANEISGRDAAAPRKPPPRGRSYLLLLAGNSTIVKRRRDDFAKYLKLNLAARLSLEYDDVRVNRVVLAPPRLLVNVSVADQNAAEIAILREDAPLHRLAQTNATLLELSGEEYRVVRLLPLFNDANGSGEGLAAAATAPGAAAAEGGHAGRRAVVLTAVGGACALAVLASVFVTVSRFLRVTDAQWPWRTPKSFAATPWILPPQRHEGHHQPKVIYSGAFVAGGGVARKDDALLAAAPPFTSALYADVARQSPRSKLHLFGCRPGSVIIPIAPPTQSPRKPPLDVRIGVDNPNYQK